MKSVNCSKPDYKKNSYIPYTLIFTTKFNDFLVLNTILTWRAIFALKTIEGTK
jgi:hypothetical protein